MYAPGLPGCALLLAEWRRDGRIGWFSRDELAAGVGALVPAVFVVVVIAWQFVPFQFVQTQKILVDQFYLLRGSNQSRLLYLRNNPFSAQFYTRGESRVLAGVEELQAALKNPAQEFFACPGKVLDTLPEAVRSNFRTVAAHGGFLLLRRLPEPERG